MLWEETPQQETSNNEQPIIEETNEENEPELTRIVTINEIRGESYNDLVSLWWEPTRIDDFYDQDPSLNADNSAYWYFGEHFVNAQFQKKDTPVENYFLSSDTLYLSLEEFRILFDLSWIDEDLYTWEEAFEQPDKITGITLGKRVQEQREREKLEERREKALSSQFSARDWSHKNLKETTKQSMHDPKSFEHVDTVYRFVDEWIYVSMTFRGKNAFGWTVRNSVEAIYDLDGKLVRIIE